MSEVVKNRDILKEDLIEYYNRCLVFGTKCEYNNWGYTVKDDTIIGTKYHGKYTDNFVVADGIECLTAESFDKGKIDELDLNQVKYLSSNSFKEMVVTHIRGPELIWVGDGSLFKSQELKTFVADKVVEIGIDAFRKCDKLEKVSLKSVKAIQNTAFMDCDNLREISIPNVNYIGNLSFAGCTNLRDLTLKNGVIVSEGAFRWCKNLKQYILD